MVTSERVNNMTNNKTCSTTNSDTHCHTGNISKVERFTLHEMRKSSGITNTQIEETCNITYRSLRNWETGTTIPNIVNVIELLSLYGYSMEQLDISQFYAVKDKQVSKHKKKINGLIEKKNTRLGIFY